jgi:glycine cleavage system protein P-like pyridoxal-binding family
MGDEFPRNATLYNDGANLGGFPGFDQLDHLPGAVGADVIHGRK